MDTSSLEESQKRPPKLRTALTQQELQPEKDTIIQHTFVYLVVPSPRV